jgi:hypothetical protein
MASRENLEEAAKDCYAANGVSGVSVVSLPGTTADEILRATPSCLVPHRKVRESTVGAIRRIGLDVRPSGARPEHATLMLPDPLTDDRWEDLTGAFSAPRRNPVAKT